MVGLALLSLSLAVPVLAQQASEAPAPVAQEDIPVSLALSGPPGCGSESDLAGRIAWRTNRVRFVPVGASERHLDVTLELAERAATATLELTLPNGRRATRVLRAATCDEAVDAAALVAAVTLDPTASTSPTTPPPDAGAPDRAATGGTGGTDAGPTPITPPPEPQGGSGGADTARCELSAALAVPAAIIAGPAPSPLYGVGFSAMGVWNRDSVISPAVRLSFFHFFGQEFDEIGGTAYFSLSELALDLCPFRIGNDVVGFFACGSFTAGTLNAEGRQTNDASSEKLPWLVAGGTLLLELRPIEFLEVELFGTLGPPLIRDSFQFGCPQSATNGAEASGCNPNLFHEVPRVSAQGGFALGVFFR